MARKTLARRLFPPTFAAVQHSRRPKSIPISDASPGELRPVVEAGDKPVHFADRVLEREVVSDGKRCRELLGDFFELLFSVSSHPADPMRTLSKTLLCVSRVLSKPLPERLQTRFSTQTFALHRPISVPVGVVGTRPLYPAHSRVFQIPHLHSFVLENPTLTQASLSKPFHLLSTFPR